MYVWLMVLTITELNGSLIYNTDGNSKTDTDCICAYMIDMSYEYEKHVRTYYLTPYCRRFSSDVMEGSTENVLTFENLRSLNLNSEDLFQWSKSVDVIEQYEIYLLTNDSKLDQEKFYNCSRFWFGSHCQYTFNLNQSIESFGDFVVALYARREKVSSETKTFPCYPHLSGCYRALEPMCLDWREICDGKIDCIGDNFGIDEYGCEDLQMIECQENEYRCRHGGQCIPLEFVHDGFTNKDCLDGSDEISQIGYDYRYKEHDFNCVSSIFFACEEKICEASYLFSCADGQCLPMLVSSIHRTNLVCSSTNRDHIYNLLLSYIPLYISLHCYASAFNRFELEFFEKNNPNLFSLVSNNCTNGNTLLPLSAQSMLAYFYLFYVNKTLNYYESSNCNDLQQYLFLPKIAFQILTLYCSRPTALIKRNHNKYIFDWIDLTRRLNIPFFYLKNPTKFLSNSSLYYCCLSLRYISKHQLFDRISDCYYDEDESPSNCSLPSDIRSDQSRTHLTNSRRYQYSAICIGISNPNNIEKDDVYNNDCELWPCFNPYSRCDGFIQCLNGIDELGCSSDICNENEFSCFVNPKMICIPYDHIYEKPINCTGGHEFLNYRRQLFYTNSSFNTSQDKYFSWKSKPLLTKSDICRDQSFGNYSIPKEIVDNIPQQSIALFHLEKNTKMCYMNSVDRVKHFNYSLRYFSQLYLGYVPATKNVSSQDTTSKEMFVLNENYVFVEYCNRGIPVFQSKSMIKTCLCPPNYFGDRCQWQSQRISLTLQIEKIISIEQINWIFEIFIFLIDDHNQIIENHERVLFIPSKDCQIKYNRYLQYPTRPKDPNKIYAIRMDVYDKLTVSYHASWHLPIEFSICWGIRICYKIILTKIK